MRAALLLAGGLVLAGPAAASAEDYGGGRVADTVVSVRTVAGGTAIVRARLQARCGSGAARRRVTLGADSSFSFTATVRGRAPDDRRVRRVARLVVAGRVGGAAASGTARERLTFRRGGRVVGRCATADRGWQARSRAASTLPAGDGFYGLTGDDAGRPRAFLLRVDGARVTRAVLEYRLRCRGRAVEMINLTPGGRIAADGTFSLLERFTLRYSDARERFTVRVRGRFARAAVTGTLSVSSVARSLGGAVVDRCRTGGTSFGAGP